MAGSDAHAAALRFRRSSGHSAGGLDGTPPSASRCVVILERAFRRSRIARRVTPPAAWPFSRLEQLPQLADLLFELAAAAGEAEQIEEEAYPDGRVRREQI